MRSHLDTTKLRWEIGRRLLRTISHKERPSISVAVYDRQGLQDVRRTIPYDLLTY